METRFYNFETKAFIEAVKDELIYLNVGSQFYVNEKGYRIKDQAFKIVEGDKLMVYIVVAI